MFPVLILMILTTKIYAENLTYFEERKQMLKAEKIVLHPRQNHTNIIPFYFGPQKPNPYNYQKIINEKDLCSKHEKVFLFVAIRSIYSTKIRRDILRDALRLYYNQDSPMRVVYGFFFGHSTNETVNKLIKEESLLHGDILQEDYPEKYSNLPIKLLHLWKWSVEYCPNTEYVMMINDELFLDLVKIVPFLFKDYISSTLDDHFAICKRIGDFAVMHRSFPRFKKMPLDYQYKGTRYPFYCNGFGFGAHIKVINKLYKASNTTTYFMPSDVWVGVLAEKLHLKIENHQEIYTVDRKMENIFADKNYLYNPVMIAVTDFGTEYLSGKEEKIMISAIASLKKHYKKYQDLKKPFSVGPTNNQDLKKPSSVGPTNNQDLKKPSSVGPTNNQESKKPSSVGPTNNQDLKNPSSVGPTNNQDLKKPSSVGPTNNQDLKKPSSVGPTNNQDLKKPFSVGPKNDQELKKSFSVTPTPCYQNINPFVTLNFYGYKIYLLYIPLIIVFLIFIMLFRARYRRYCRKPY